MLWGLLVGGLVVTRAIARRVAARIAPVERCLLVGGADVFERLAGKFEHLRGVELVGRDRPEDRERPRRAARARSNASRIHRLIIDTDATGSGDDARHHPRWRTRPGCRSACCRRTLGAVGSSVVFDDIGGLVLMGVPRFGLSRSSLALKRGFDLVGAAVALVCRRPLMAMIAIAIKLDSRGPVLFRQTRIGPRRDPVRDAQVPQHGRRRRRAEGLAARAQRGRRRCSRSTTTRGSRASAGCCADSGLDELPQLFNVLAGSMSLVGPRPLVIDEDNHVTGFDRRPPAPDARASPVAGRRSARPASRWPRWSRSTTSTSPTGRPGPTSRSSSRRSATSPAAVGSKALQTRRWRVSYVLKTSAGRELARSGPAAAAGAPRRPGSRPARPA